MDINKHYLENKKQLMAVAKRSVLNNIPTIADECVSQAYCNVLTYLSNPNNHIREEEFDSFLYRILFNCIYDSNDQELKRGMTGRRDDNLGYDTDSVELIPIEGEITLDIYRQMCLNVILGKFNKLSTRTHNVLNLYFIYGYTHSEVAGATGLSEKTSRNIVYNSLKLLRDAAE